MKAELKKAWVDKLRSGEIKQAQHVLRDENNAMCCLGVLLDVHDHDGWNTDQAIAPVARKPCYPHKLATDEHDYISGESREALGLDFLVERESGSGFVYAGHVLAKMNDDGKSFAEIADWIEANVPADAA